MSATLRKGWCPGALRPMASADGLLVRLRITGGVVSANAAIALSDLAEQCGTGLLDLSGRGNLQIRGVRETMLRRLQNGLLTLGLLDPNAEAEAVRNVMASPLAGLHGGIDTRPLVSALEARLAADGALHALPAKFGILIDDGSWPTLAAIDADIRFDWDGTAFAIGIGGTRADARQVGFCRPAELADRAARVALAFLGVAQMHPEARRMRDVRDAAARACDARSSPVRGGKWSDEVRADEEPFRLPDNDGGNCQFPHSTPADTGPAFSRKPETAGLRDVVGLRANRGANPIPVLGLAAPFGRLDAGMLRAAARLAGTGLGELRLTPWRVLLVPGVHDVADLPGFISDPSDPRLSVAACVGSAGCARATTDVPADAARLASMTTPGPDIVLHVSGCAKGCAKASPTAITLVARDGRYDLVRDGRAGDSPCRTNLDMAAVHDTLRELA